MGIYAGIAKDPPQMVSLSIPTNVGIHGNTDTLSDINASFFCY